MDRSDPTGQADRLYDVLLDYLESSERGLQPDSAQLLKSHPEFAAELQEFLETQNRLEGLTAPVREVSQAVLQAARAGSQSLLGVAAASGKTESAVARSVGQYEILGEIGRGGMGVVYKARDTKLGRLVALKMIRSASHASPAEVKRFLAEARAKARLNHPNVVPLYEIGEAEGMPYFVMALVEGGSLQMRLADGPLPTVQAAKLTQQVAEAIQHAHERGVLHRDLKPHNILLQQNTEAAPTTAAEAAAPGGRAGGASPPQPVPMVSDFGLARLAGQDGLTASGEILGTPGYMPPEQAAGHAKAVGPHSDVYSLGAVLYCLLTGRPPFQAATLVETLRLVQEEDPVPPRRLNPAVTRDLEAVCLKSLEKAPEQRYARAADLAGDLQRFLDGTPTLARPRSSLGRVWLWARRRPAKAGMAAALVAAVMTLVAGAVVYTVQLRVHNTELGTAREQERMLKEEAEARGRLLQRKAYAEGIRRAAVCWENLRQQMKDQDSDRPVPDVLSEMPRAEDCLLSAPPGGAAEDLRSFEWFCLKRLGSGLRVLRGHRSDPVDVAFSRDGRLVLTAGGNDGTARVWDVPACKEIWRLPRRGDVSTVALSPDGRLVALTVDDRLDERIGGDQRNLQIWDRSSQERVANLTLGARSVFALAFAPDGRSLAATAEGPDRAGMLVVWDVETWKRRFERRAAGGGSALCFSADSRSLAEAQPNGQGPVAIRIHDLQTGQEKSISTGRFDDSITRLAFSPDGRTLASGGYHGQVVLWDTSTGSPQKDWRILGMVISGLGFLRDGETLAVAAKTPPGVRAKAIARLWNVATGRPCSDAWGPGSLIHNLAVAPDRLVALACGDTMVRLWNPERLSESRELPCNHKETWTVAFSPDGRTLATGGDDHKIRLWDVPHGTLRTTLPVQLALVSGLAFHPEGKVLASVNYEGRLCLWDVASGTLLGPPLKISSVPLRCVAFSADGRTLATGGRDHLARLWNFRTNEGGQPELSLRAEWPGSAKDVLCLAFSPDGHLLASGCDDRTIRLWDGRSGLPVWTIEEHGPVRCVAFAPDGRLVWGTDEGEVKLAATAEGSRVTVLAGHAGKVRTVTLTHDGRTLASAGDDQTVRLWQVATGQSLMTLHGHDESIYAASFAPDGRLLATGCHDGTVRLWLADSDGR